MAGKAGASIPWVFGSAWRLLVTLALTLALVVGTLAILIVNQTRASLVGEAIRQNTLVSRLVASSVSVQFEGLGIYVESFARRPLVVRAVANRDTAGVRRHLEELITQNRRLDRAFVTDAKGTLWADFPPAPEVIGQNFAFRDWYQGVVASQRTYVSEVYARAAPPRRYLVAIATPLRNAQQEIIGYLVAQHTLDALGAWIKEIEPSMAGAVALIDHHGRLALKRTGGEEAPLDVSGDRLVLEVLNGTPGNAVAADPLTGEQSLISYAPVPAIGWGVLSRQPLATVFAPAADLQQTIGALALVAFVIMLGMGFIWLDTVRRQQHALRAAHGQVDAVNRQLEAANKELEAFSYSIAHDLRAPLRAIDGFSRLVVDTYDPLLPEDARRYLDRVRQGARHMGELIDDLLTFSRLGRQPLNRQPIDTTRLAEQIAEELQPENPAATITIEELPRADADPALLRQVFANLLSNALKFTRHRSQPLVVVTHNRTPEGATFIVRDNGVGFDMCYVDKLFGVFQRLHRAEEYEGTGVGLAIVQRVIHRHGGRVWAEGAIDQGATFYFTLGGTGNGERSG